MILHLSTVYIGGKISRLFEVIEKHELLYRVKYNLKLICTDKFFCTSSNTCLIIVIIIIITIIIIIIIINVISKPINVTIN